MLPSRRFGTCRPRLSARASRVLGCSVLQPSSARSVMAKKLKRDAEREERITMESAFFEKLLGSETDRGYPRIRHMKISCSAGQAGEG